MNTSKTSKILGQPTLNGKPIEITDSWAKMKFYQYLKTLKLKDDSIELISILTGLEYDLLKKAKVTGLETVLLAGEFLKTPPKFPETPKHIGKYKLPLNAEGIFNVQLESLAQFEDMRSFMNKVPYLPFETLIQLMKGEIGLEALRQYPDLQERFYAHTEAYATYCALYLQKLRDGEYDGDKALKMVPELMEYPASDIISAGGFFFVKLRSLLTGTKRSSQNTTRHRRKSIGKRSQKRLGVQPR